MRMQYKRETGKLPEGRINVVVGVVRDMDDIYDEIDPEYVIWLEEKVEQLLKDGNK